LEKAAKYYPIRRSTRLPLEIPVRVTSLDPKLVFTEDCNTVTVNAHGCGLISPKKLAAGTRVRLEIVSDNQSTTARVLDVVPLNDDNSSWLLGMEMEHAGNFWGIKYAPADWAEEEAAPVPAAAQPMAGPAKAPEVKTAPPRKPDSKPAASAKAEVKAPLPKKEIPEAVLRRLLSECRLAAISSGACYVQTGTTFPTHAPVQIRIKAANTEHKFHGSVRVEHVGAGMGIEFTGSGEEHEKRIAALIESLSAHGDKLPEVKVELAAPDKSAVPKAKGASVTDTLLGLILVGGSLKRSDFLHELERQRKHG
jgi:PilZ domain-containing protein